jgi:hypothetical protein
VIDEIRKYDWPKDVAVAVATGESGLNAKAKSHTNDHGVFQINGCWFGKYGLNPTNIYNYKKNIYGAYRIWLNNKSFSPWVVYQTGAYRQYL